MNNEQLRAEIRRAVCLDPCGPLADLLNRCYVALETPQHARDSAELRRLCAERDKLKRQLRAEGDRIAELNAKLGEQPSAGVVMPESVGVLILGGLFHGGSGPELGDIDIEPNMRVLERIQMELVTSSDDVHLELFARLNGKEVGRG